MEIGQRVKNSGYALKSSRDYWQSQASYEKKAQAKKWFEDKLAMRGTITGILVANPKIGSGWYRIAPDSRAAI